LLNLCRLVYLLCTREKYARQILYSFPFRGFTLRALTQAPLETCTLKLLYVLLCEFDRRFLLALIIGRSHATTPASKGMIFHRFLLRYITMTKLLLEFQQFCKPLIKHALTQAPFKTCIKKVVNFLTCAYPPIMTCFHRTCNSDSNPMRRMPIF